MRKIQYTFTALTALMVLFACSPERLEETSGPGGQAMVLTALSARNVPDTKTELQDNGPDIWWSAADAIQVFQGSEGTRFVSTNRAPALQAEFRGYLPVSTGATLDLWAVYPYDEANTSDGSGITATVPADQKAIAGTFDPTALLTVAHTDNLTLAFQNVCGGLKFKVTQDWIQQVEFRSNDGTPLAGRVSVSMDASGHPVDTGIEEPSDAVRLTAPYGETFQPDTWYYLCCLPATLSEGFTLTFRSETQTAVKDYSGEKVIERSMWGRLSAADTGVAPENEPNSIFDNVVYYTTTNDKVIEPRNLDSFGAPFVSNTYDDDRGIIVFDGPVTTIPYAAFELQETLSGITMPVSVREIGSFAFSVCPALEDIVIPDGLVSIGDYAFQNSILTEIDLPGSLQYVSPTAFSGSNSLECFFSPLATTDGRGLVIDGTLVAFARGDLESPVDYEVEAGITGLADRVFESVWQFREVTLPDSIVQIGEGAFAYCNSITAFHGAFASKDGRFLIQDNTLKAVAFGNYPSFELPEGISRIGGYVFAGSGKVSSPVIPEGITEIGVNAFANCYQMTSVSLPASLRVIGEYAFGWCRNESFTEFTIPSGVEEVGGNILADCCYLTAVRILPATPPATMNYNNPLGWNLDNAVMYVPSASLSSYQQADGWRNFSYQALSE